MFAVKNMFLFLARQLIGLKNIDDPLFSRRYYLLEVEKKFDEKTEFDWICLLEFEYGSIIYSCS